MRGVRTFIRFAWSLLTTVAVLAGSAFLLVRWAGWPLPDHLPTGDDVSAFLDNPQAPSVAKAFGAGIAWLLWLTLLAAVIVQAWAQRFRRVSRLRLPRPFRIVTAGLVGVGALNLANPASAHDLPADASATISQPADPTDTRPPQPALDDTQPTEPPDPHAHPTDGVNIPGGWVNWPLASGILATSAAALLNATHPRSASALVRSLRAAQHPDTDPTAALGEPATADDIALLEQAATTPAALTIATDGHGHGLSTEALPRTGVGLTGPGADDAIRGLLAIAAVTTAPVTVITTRSLLTRLTQANVDLPNITAVDDPAQATHLVQLEIGTRYAAKTSAGNTARHPPMILITDPPIDNDQVSALATLGHPLGIYIVIHGHWTKGTTWQINPAGQATDNGAAIGRLNTLSHTAIGELAQLLSTQPPSPAATTPTPPHDGPALQVRLHILGKPRLVTPSPTAPRLRRSGAWQIATYLALHPDGVPRSDLIEQVFGDMRTIDAATTSLNTCLHELRRALTIDGHSALLTTGGGYRLDHHHINVDWWQLQTHLQRGNLDSAVALYQGPIAEGYQWDWLPEHRQTARRTVANAYTLLAASTDNPHEALNHALAGIDVDPYTQDCYEAAIRAHLQTGNHHGAHMILRDLRHRLPRSRTDLSPAIMKLMPASRTGNQTPRQALGR